MPTDPEYQRRYYLKHRERRLAQAAQRQRAKRAEYLSYHRAYYLSHKTEFAQAGRERRRAKGEEIRQQKAKYASEHSAESVARVREWRRRNPDRVAEQARRRNALKRGAGVATLTPAQWAAIKVAFDHRCAYCGCRPERLTQDHVIPLSKGGQHTAENVVPACTSCNCRKSARLLGAVA